VKWLGGLRAVGATAVVTALVAALTFGVSTLILHPSKLKLALTGGSPCTLAPGFCINQGGGNTISSTPTPTFTAATLDPGAQRYLWYKVTNPLTVPITVSSLSIGSVTSPAGCAQSNLDLSHTTFTGAFVVAAGSTSSVSVPISLMNLTGTVQNDPSSSTENCAGKTFNFTFTGSAKYSEVYSTATAITNPQNPSNVGQAVTYTATVTASATSSQDPVPSHPTGTVTFKDNGTAIAGCSNLTVASTGTTTSNVTCLSPAYGAAGTHPITAVFTSGDGTEFSNSPTSTTFNQVVDSSGVTTKTVLTSAPNPSVAGGAVTFSATVTRASGTGSTPGGMVNFYSCTSATPSSCSTTPLGSGTLTSGRATLATSSLPVGPTNVEAIYGGSSGFVSSTSNIATQTVAAAKTTTVITSAPDPSLVSQSVTLGATVTKSTGSGTPAGSVSFFLGTPGGSHTSLGSGTLNGSAQTSITTSALPVGPVSLYAVYAGNASFTTSTSPVISQLVIALPTQCGSRSFNNYFLGSPFFPIIEGTSQNDFIDAQGLIEVVDGGQGNDCIVVGDGLNVVSDGNGNDTVMAGNGASAVTVGNGSDSVTVGNGSLNAITVGNGTDTIAIGNGSHNVINLGNGNNTVTVTSPGSNDTINSRSGNESINLGSGTFNTFNGGHGHNTCHLPAPPSSFHGTTASYYHDTLTNCTVVSP
jgi:hypothetical protein